MGWLTSENPIFREERKIAVMISETPNLDELMAKEDRSVVSLVVIRVEGGCIASITSLMPIAIPLKTRPVASVGAAVAELERLVGAYKGPYEVKNEVTEPSEGGGRPDCAVLRMCPHCFVQQVVEYDSKDPQWELQTCSECGEKFGRA